MAVAKTGSSKTASTLRVRKLNGTAVTQVLYNGKAVGGGKYFAGSIGGNLICDANGVPEHFRDIGSLELV